MSHRECVAAIVFLLLGVCLSGGLAAEEGGATEPQSFDFFESKIRPVLVERCYSCHSSEAQELQGELRLDTRDAARAGGSSGPAIVPGDPESSLLMAAIRYEQFEMPPDGKLPDEVIADFEKWILGGAADPRDEVASSLERSSIDNTTARQFWSFQPPKRHSLPAVQHSEWPQNRLDWFILSAIEAAELQPNPPADRRSLIRRLSFDLTGLPPSPQDVAAFVADDSPAAIERWVDRMLASPHYGERLARLWLDIARYAEDQAHIVGDDRSLCYPNAYLYRDWVIDALNKDLPYDQFLRLQLAADLFEPENKELHVSLGFLGLGPKYYDRKSLAVKADEWEDRVDTISRGLLGLTVACARCHDHKYDPIPTEDYYGLAGVFASTEMFNRPLDEDRETNDKGQAKSPEDAAHIVREGEPHDVNVFIRGNVENKGPVVPRHFLSAISPGEPIVLNTGSGRRELADAIASPQNPLTARVIVNRIWALHFGHPLVATTSNFGTAGALPSHPELLDDLAVRFMENGWSLKWLQRQIVLSAAYQQSSHASSEKMAADPENRWLARMPRRRLSVEAWRDAVLMVSGRLDFQLHGPSLDPLDIAARRRTVYSEISRLQLNQLLALFDYPDPNLHAEKRTETTTPLQKLFLLNSPFMVHHAQALADQLLAAQIESVPACELHGLNSEIVRRIELAYQWVHGRAPTEREIELAADYLGSGQGEAEERLQRWQQFAHVLLASNEFLFLD